MFTGKFKDQRVTFIIPCRPRDRRFSAKRKENTILTRPL